MLTSGIITVNKALYSIGIAAWSGSYETWLFY